MNIVPTFKEFHVSETIGFLLEDPLQELPEYFADWNRIGKNTGPLLQTHQLRNEVSKMPLLDAGLLVGYRQRRLAYMLLSFIGNGYVWQEGDAGVIRTVPHQLGIPWCEVATQLGQQPAMAHCCFVLSNWRPLDVNRSPSRWNMAPICILPGGEDCQHFLRISFQIELDAVPGLKAILSGLESVTGGDTGRLGTDLQCICDAVMSMTNSMNSMNDKVDPNIFYTKIRPILSGWGGACSPLPEGLYYDGVSDTPRLVTGASAAQSSTIQCFDAAIGITHEPEEQVFLDKMRSYMPEAHRHFVEAIHCGPSIKHFVESSADSDLQRSYNQCVNALAHFRTKHIQIVTKYIVVMSRKWKQNEHYEGVSNRGTGGQDLLPFVKALRNSTRSHVLNHESPERSRVLSGDQTSKESSQHSDAQQCEDVNL